MRRSNTTDSLISSWEARLSSEGLPPELELIRRRRTRRDSEARFEEDTDLATLEAPPEFPKPKRSGRPVAYDITQAKESAQDLLLHGNLTGRSYEAWIGYCAGLSERVIASRMGIHRDRLRREYLDPLKYRAGIPTHPQWKPVKTRNRPFGLKYRKSPT